MVRHGLAALYHTKNYQGTTTNIKERRPVHAIIPYQELPGNYNHADGLQIQLVIIPYQELPGNYNMNNKGGVGKTIIPYQELPGKPH